MAFAGQIPNTNRHRRSIEKQPFPFLYLLSYELLIGFLDSLLTKQSTETREFEQH